MALARARQFQHEQTLKENETKRIEKLFQLKIVQPGDAVNYPKHGDSICIHYAGYLEDGTCFDNSWQRGQSINFLLGSKQVIEAIELVVPLLSRGEKARLVIPSEYGYGERGYPPIIPPNSTLIYEIQLITFSSVGHVEKILREKREQNPFALVP
mmetsp:Transcript_17099/g.18553  ORF Transcript_17099/g.18553 Transcript_17099/m.18553 type:complete len:155 (-) Transcript_17099:62-526(-)